MTCAASPALRPTARVAGVYWQQLKLKPASDSAVRSAAEGGIVAVCAGPASPAGIVAVR